MSQKLVSFESLIVWQKAHQLVIDVYKITADFPEGEKFGLVSQMRRAAISITSNIAEGFCRKGTKNKLQFYNISSGSLSELISQTFVARDLGFVKTDTATQLLLKTDEVGRLLNGLRKSLTLGAKS